MKLKIFVLLCLMQTLAYPKAHKPKGKHMWFNHNIVELCKQNSFFRKEIVTGPHSQVVLMNVLPGQDIGEEVHKVDQSLVFVQGKGQAILNGKTSEIAPGHLVFVPAGTRHNFKNTGSEDLKLYTIYAPTEHKPGEVVKTKPESGY